MHGKILVFDPALQSRSTLKYELTEAHCTVFEADDCKTCLDEIGKQNPDLVLLGPSIPPDRLQDISQKIRAVSTDDAISIIVLENETGPYARPYDRATLYAAGIDAIIPAPLNTNYVLARIRAMLRKQAITAEWKLHKDIYRILNHTRSVEAEQLQGKAMIIASNHSPWADHLQHLSNLETRTYSLNASGADLAKTPLEDTPDIFILVVQEEKEAQNMLGLTATLRSHASTHHSQILILQLFEDQELSAQFLDRGAHDILENKPSAKELALRTTALLQRKNMEDKMRNTVRDGLTAAMYDPLTALYNRRFALSQLAETTYQSQKSNSPFSIMIADIDHFKRINDAYGHRIGDNVLVQLAQQLQSCLRTEDTIARIGGEEFMIILPNVSTVQAKNIARRICRHIDQSPIRVSEINAEINVTISIGLSVNSDPALQPKLPHHIFDEADQALYLAKNRGRNCIKVGQSAA